MADNPLFDSVFDDLEKDQGFYQPKTPSLMDDAIDEVGRASKVPTNLAGMKARDANPDQYQQIKELSDKVGLDTGFVERNMPELKRQQVARDVSDIAAKSPELGMWFAKDDNPSAIKVDELRHLSGLHWLVAAQVQAFKGGVDQVEFGTLSNKALMGQATPEELARADEMFNGQQPRTYGADGWLEQSWVAANQQIPTLYNYIKQSLTGGAAGFVGGAVAGGSYAAIAGQLGPQAATPEEVLTVPGAAISTGIWTGRAGALSAAYLYSFEQSAGPAYYDFKSMKDENGVPLDDDVARIGAYVVGAIGGGLEVIGTEKVASLVPGADKVTGLFTKDAVKEALKIPTVRQALKNFAVNISEAGLTEVSTEVGQQAVQIFVQEMAKVASNKMDGTNFEQADAGDIASELIAAADQTAKAMTILGPVLGSTRLGADLKRANRASADKLILDEVAKHAQGDELVKRLPQKAQEAVEALTANGPVQSVYVQPEGIRTLFQTSEEVDQFIDSLGIRDEWNEASAIGRDVQIPFSVYYSKIAATEAQQALAPYTKLSADAMTPLDADLFNEAWEEAKDQLIAEASAAMEAERAMQSGVDQIAEDVKNKVMNAGITPDQAQQYSKLYASFFRTMGSRMGMAPEEIYSRYGFDVQRALPGGEYKPVSALDISLSAIRSGRVPQYRRRVERAKGSSLLERIRQRGGIEDVGGEIAATGLKGRQYIRKTTSGDMLGPGDNSFKPDAVTGQLWEEGYFPEFQERPTPDVLYEAIRGELAGDRRYSSQIQQSAEIADLAGLVAFADMLDELGIDAGTMTDDEVRAALDGVNRDAESGALFQGATLDQMEAQAAEMGVKLSLGGKGDVVRVSMIRADEKGQGAGTRVMQSLTGWADANGKTLALTPEKIDGTTSKSRLVDFYKRFGFRENKGRSRDLSISETMIREPVRELFQSAPATESAEFKAWFGDSKVVDADGKPLVVYHGGSAGDFQDGAIFLAANRELASKHGMRSVEGRTLAVSPLYAKISNPLVVDYRDKATYSDHLLTTVDMKPEIVRSNEISRVSHIASGAVKKARVYGFDGVKFVNWKDLGVAGDIYVALSPEQIKSVNNRGTFDPNDPRILYQDAKRGSIQISEGRTVINLFDQANLSTFLHESGHFFLEVFRDLAQQGGADGPLAQDWTDLTAFLGITGDTIPVEAHEKFARSFEAYLFEGKAPSEEVAGIFARFRSWLVFVYKQVSRLNAPINDKIRGVMDRLIATDEEIASARTAPEFKPQAAMRELMTDAQWQAYEATAARAVENAKRTMDERLMGEVRRETTAEWREARRKLKDEVQREYENEPVYRAMQYLRTGDWNEYADDGWPLPAPAERLYLDRDAIVSIMGEGALQRMPRSVPPMYRAKGGVSPDYVAELFGFQSGHDMLTRMMSVPSLPRAVAGEVDVRMRAKFGDLMGDAVARAREAREAITNDATGELLEAELEVLVRKGLVSTSISRADAKRAARNAIRAKPIREALRQKLYMNANSKAAQEAERAILAGDWPAAVKAKQRQMVNHYMALEAVDAKKDVESAVNYLGRFTGRKRPDTVDPEYLDQIEALIERFDFRKSITLTQAQRRLSLAAFIEAQEAMGNIVQIPDELRDDAFRKPYKSMTTEDLLGLQDTVKNIEHLGRLKNKLLANKEAREFASARDEVVAAIGASQREKPALKTRNPTILDESLSLLKSLDASLLKVEQVLNWMDGDDPNGPLRRLIWQPIADAEARENDMQKQYSTKFMEILGKLDPKRLNEWVTFQGVKYQRSNILAVALNMGNEGNYDKMKRAEVWGDADVSMLVGNLNAEEWQAVQQVWDTINELWPQIAALQKRLTGVEPMKVEPRDVQTPFGTLAGGYYPLIYDANRSADVEDRQAASADKLFENTYLRPTTWHGFTKERTQAYARPISFDINGAGSHLISVIHDLTHREAIIDANKLLTNSTVRAEIENRYGKEIYRQFVPWLQSIANDRAPNDGLSAVNRVFRGIRSRSTMVGMGFRISTIITQVMGYSSALEMVPARRLAGAMKDFVAGPLAMNELVNSLSGEMRHRSSNLDRDIRDQIRQQTGQKTLLEQARKFAFVGLGYADRAITVPTWMAAYTDHLSRYPTDKEGGIAHADKVIRLSQGSGGAKDLAAITRGRNEAAKLITMFYSYFSAYYNRQRNWGRKAKAAIENGTYSDFPSLLAAQIFMTVIPAVGAKLIVGDGPSDDETYAEWAARQIYMYPLSAVPIVRDAAGTFDKGFGYAFTPAGRAVDEAVIQPIKLIGDMIDGEAEAREVAVQALQTTGYVLKLPTGQLATSTNNVWKAIEDDDFQLRDLVLTRKE